MGWLWCMCVCTERRAIIFIIYLVINIACCLMRRMLCAASHVPCLALPAGACGAGQAGGGGMARDGGAVAQSQMGADMVRKAS